MFDSTYVKMWIFQIRFKNKFYNTDFIINKSSITQMYELLILCIIICKIEGRDQRNSKMCIPRYPILYIILLPTECNTT